MLGVRESLLKDPKSAFAERFDAVMEEDGTVTAQCRACEASVLATPERSYQPTTVSERWKTGLSQHAASHA
jgi:hypothetical protein